MKMLWPITIALALYALVCLLVYFKQESLLFYPEVLPDDYDYTFSFPCREVSLRPADNVLLNLALIPGDSSSGKGVVLYFHGNAGSLRSWAAVAEDFRKHGYDCCIPDYRGFGKSRGPQSERAFHEDARYIYTWLCERYPPEKIVVYGRSLGSGIAARLAAEHNVRLLVLETPYYSMQALARHTMPWLPTDLLLRYPLRTDTVLPQVRCPIYLIHGSNDDLIPPESAHKLAQIPGVKAEVSIIEGGAHNNLAHFAAYRNRIADILQ